MKRRSVDDAALSETSNTRMSREIASNCEEKFEIARDFLRIRHPYLHDVLKKSGDAGTVST